MAPIVAPPPHRSLAGWAVLAVTLIVCSYVFTLLLAAACVYLPYLLLSTLALNFTTVLLFLCGLITAGTMLWSLGPRRENFRPPGPRLDGVQEPRLFSEPAEHLQGSQ